MILLLLLGLICIAVSVTALVKVGTLRRLRTAERLSTIGEYGFAADPGAGLPVHQTSGIADFVGRVGGLFARVFGGVSEADLRAEMMKAGIYTTSPRTLLGYRVLLAMLLPISMLLLFGLGVLPVMLAIAMMPAGWMLPISAVRRSARQRLHTIDRKLPDLIDLLVVTVEAGLGFNAALRMASDRFAGPLSDELRLTLQEQTMGLSVADALRNMAERADTPAMRSFVRAMAQGERLGISTGHIMRNLAHEMRQRRRKVAEERAQKAPIKMLFPLVFLIFPALFIVLLTPAVIQLIQTLGG
jgi:tight adherence protein C